jgi:hypothetical protein
MHGVNNVKFICCYFHVVFTSHLDINFQFFNQRMHFLFSFFSWNVLVCVEFQDISRKKLEETFYTGDCQYKEIASNSVTVLW